MSAPPPHRREPLNEPVAAEPPQLTKEFQDYEQHEDDLECEEPELQKGGAEVERVRSQRQKMALRVEDAEGCAPVAGVCVAWDSADCRSPLPRAFVPSAVRSDAARGEEVEREAHAAEHVDSGVVEGGKDLYLMSESGGRGCCGWRATRG